MVEEPDFDEYFVPIPLKCIGRLRDASGLPGQSTLQGIRARYSYLRDDAEFGSFWSLGHGPGNRARMNTVDHMGYYEILTQTKPNIVIGYSQGGLVARYLAWLDQVVFQQDAIVGVVTLAAPNYGSPLADLERTVESAIKWLGGLSATSDNAFHELNICHHDEPDSVLRCVNTTKLDRIAYGAVITADNSLNSIVRSFLSGAKGRLFRWFGGRWTDDLARGSAVYRRKVMREQLQPADYNSQIIQKKLDDLGTKVNSKANHNSGKSRDYAGGKRNWRHIRSFLK